MTTPVAISQGMNYSLKPTSVACNRKQLTIVSSNKTSFSPTDVALFYVPSLRNHVMDGKSAYLRFNATITGAGFIDNNASCFINRIQTYGAGGQLISDIQGYNLMAIAMLDLQLSQSEKIGLSAVLGNEATLIYPTTPAAPFTTANKPTAAEVSSMIPSANRLGQAVADATTYSFCIPLIHPLFSLSEKYFPSFALSDDIRIEITWEAATTALVSSTNYSISNPEIIVDYLQLDEQVISMIKQTYAGRDLIVPTQDYHRFTSQITSGTQGSISQIIPAKQKSARAFFFVFRPSQTQVSAGYTLSAHVNPFYKAGDYFNLNIGGLRCPPKPITTHVDKQFSEYLASTQTALHAFNSLEMNGSLTTNYYNVSPAVNNATTNWYTFGANSYQSGFILGINLDHFRGQNDTMQSGLSLANVTTYYEGYLAVAPTQADGTTAQSVSIDTFLLHDSLFVIGAESGIMSVQF